MLAISHAKGLKSDIVFVSVVVMELRFSQDLDANLTVFHHRRARRFMLSTRGTAQCTLHLTAVIAESNSLKDKGNSI